jgi:hypothetical protein
MLSGYKTIAIAVLVTVFGALQAMDWQSMIHDPQTLGWITMGIGIIMGILRAFTTSPVFVSKKDDVPR